MSTNNLLTSLAIDKPAGASQKEYNKLLKVLQEHEMIDCFVKFIDVDKLRELVLQNDPIIANITWEMPVNHKFIPYILIQIIEDQNQDFFDQLRDQNSSVINIVIFMLFHASEIGGVKGVDKALYFCKCPKVLSGLKYLAFKYKAYLQEKTIKYFIGKLNCLILKLESMNDINELVNNFISLSKNGNIVHKIDANTTIFIETMNLIIDSMERFDDYNFFFQALRLLHSEKPLDCCSYIEPFIKYAAIIGRYHEHSECSKDDIINVIRLLYKHRRSIYRINDFEIKFQILVQMTAQKIDQNMMKKITKALLCNRYQAAQTVLTGLLVKYNQYHSDLLHVCLNLYDKIVIFFNSNIVNYNLNEKIHIFLEKCIKQDNCSAFFNFTKFFTSSLNKQVSFCFDIGFNLLLTSQNIYIFQGFVEILNDEDIDKQSFFEDYYTTQLKKRFKNTETLINRCLNQWLIWLFIQHGKFPEQFMDSIKDIYNSFNDPEKQILFLSQLKIVIKHDADIISHWLYSISKAKQPEQFIVENDPQKAFQVTLKEVKPILNQYISVFFGYIPIKKSNDHVPSTDGKQILLPPFYAQFYDDKNDLYNNRNATLYVSDLLHELCYHVLAGSFLVDSENTISKFSDTSMAHLILNILEDFRGREHFKAHMKNQHLIQIMDESEQFIVSQYKSPNNWKQHFFDLFIYKGSLTYTPGDFDKDEKKKETQLLSRKCSFYSPYDGKRKDTTLGHVLNIVIQHINSVKGKTVAHSLLIVKPVYQIFSQAIGCLYETRQYSQFTTIEFTIQINININITEGQDIFSTEPDKSRKSQLIDLAQMLQQFHTTLDVPENIKENSGHCIDMNFDLDIDEDFDLQDIICPIELEFSQGVKPKLFKGEANVSVSIESRYHPEFKQLYSKYFEIFQMMQDELQKLMYEKDELEHQGNDPDEIIIENIIEAFADPKTIPFLELYENTTMIPKQLETLEVRVLVDSSGSTQGETLETEKVFASVIYSAFEILEFPIKLYFFSSNITTYLTQIKNLNAIGNIQSKLSNRDGIAIRHIAQTFQYSEYKKLLIIITDGMPCDILYEHATALADTYHAMLTCKNQDIMVWYFNIGGLAPGVLEDFQKYTHHTQVFHKPKDLIQYIPSFVKQLIKEVEKGE